MTKKPLIGEVDVKDLIERLAFTQEGTEDAALEQSKLYFAAVTYRIKKMRARQEAEMRADNIRTDYSLKMRFKHKGTKGTTERMLSDLVERVPELREAIQALATAKRLEEWAKGLLDAYEHRRSSIKVLAQFAFIQDNFSGQHEVERMKSKRERLKKEIGKEQVDE